MNRSKRWMRDETGQLFYNYSNRYDAAHRRERISTFRTVQLIGVWGLCPFCLRPVALDRIRPDRKQRKRWFELHHVAGYQKAAITFWWGIPVCSQCHIPKLHHPSVWIEERHNPDHNRNTWSAAQWFRVRYLVAIVVALVIRTVLRIVLGHS